MPRRCLTSKRKRYGCTPELLLGSLLCVAGLAATLIVWRELRANTARQLGAAFREAALLNTEHLQSSVTGPLAELLSFASFVATFPPNASFPVASFRQASAGLLYQSPAVYQLAFARLLRRQDLNASDGGGWAGPIWARNASGVNGLAVQGDKPLYCILQATAKQAPPWMPLGFDVLSEPSIFLAALLSARSGDITFSAPLQLKIPGSDGGDSASGLKALVPVLLSTDPGAASTATLGLASFNSNASQALRMSMTGLDELGLATMQSLIEQLGWVLLNSGKAAQVGEGGNKTTGVSAAGVSGGNNGLVSGANTTSTAAAGAGNVTTAAAAAAAAGGDNATTNGTALHRRLAPVTDPPNLWDAAQPGSPLLRVSFAPSPSPTASPLGRWGSSDGSKLLNLTELNAAATPETAHQAVIGFVLADLVASQILTAAFEGLELGGDAVLVEDVTSSTGWAQNELGLTPRQPRRLSAVRPADVPLGKGAFIFGLARRGVKALDSALDDARNTTTTATANATSAGRRRLQVSESRLPWYRIYQQVANTREAGAVASVLLNRPGWSAEEDAGNDTTAQPASPPGAGARYPISSLASSSRPFDSFMFAVAGRVWAVTTIGSKGATTPPPQQTATILLAGIGASALASVLLYAVVQRVLAASRRQLQAQADALAAARTAQEAHEMTVAGAAHELRNPLHCISASAAFLQLQLEPSSPLRPDVEAILSAAEALHKLTTDMLTLAEVRTKKLKVELAPFSIAALFERLSLTHRAMAQPGVTLRWRVAPDVPAAVVSDQLRVAQILANGLTNACKFCSAGEIVLSAWVDWGPGPGNCSSSKTSSGVSGNGDTDADAAASSSPLLHTPGAAPLPGGATGTRESRASWWRRWRNAALSTLAAAVDAGIRFVEAYNGTGTMEEDGPGAAVQGGSIGRPRSDSRSKRAAEGADAAAGTAIPYPWLMLSVTDTGVGNAGSSKGWSGGGLSSPATPPSPTASVPRWLFGSPQRAPTWLTPRAGVEEQGKAPPRLQLVAPETGAGGPEHSSGGGVSSPGAGVVATSAPPTPLVSQPPLLLSPPICYPHASRPSSARDPPALTIDTSGGGGCGGPPSGRRPSPLSVFRFSSLTAPGRVSTPGQPRKPATTPTGEGGGGACGGEEEDAITPLPSTCRGQSPPPLASMTPTHTAYTKLHRLVANKLSRGSGGGSPRLPRLGADEQSHTQSQTTARADGGGGGSGSPVVLPSAGGSSGSGSTTTVPPPVPKRGAIEALLGPSSITARVRGSGLGLPVARRLAQELGGALSLTRRVEGADNSTTIPTSSTGLTRYTLCLPLSLTVSGAAGGGGGSGGAPSPGRAGGGARSQGTGTVASTGLLPVDAVQPPEEPAGFSQSPRVAPQASPSYGSGLTAGRFSLQVPPPPASTTAPQPDATTPASASQRFHIIVLDDEATNRLLLTRMCKALGHVAEAFEDGDCLLPALQAAAATGWPYDLVLTDIVMVRMDGATACAEARRAGYVELPIVATTGNARAAVATDVVAGGGSGGFNAVLEKPFTLASLASVLSSIKRSPAPSPRSSL